MSSESETDEEGDTLELAYSYKVKGKNRLTTNHVIQIPL